MIRGENLPNIPWENRPEGNEFVVWRYSGNPVIKRHQIRGANSIFNSAVIAKDGAFVGVFRSDNTAMEQKLFFGKSKDGLSWELEHTPIQLLDKDGTPIGEARGYDPRVCLLEDKYYVTWCNNYHGPTIGVAYTYDFEKFYQLENSYLPFNRNGVLFPRKINGKYMMLSRPSDNGHTPFGDMFISQSPDMEHWGYHRHVMRPKDWGRTKVGAGPIPIETDEGWLIFFHGVLTTCNGFIYSMGAALLDLDEPWKVLYRCKPYVLHPDEYYECVGDVPNVVFPCAALTDAATGRIAVYYGAADTVVALAFTQVDELIKHIKDNADK